MWLLKRIVHIVVSGDERSALLKKNIVLSFFNKGIAVIVSFLLVSVTIDYVDTEQYGIWLTLSTITYWISLFDFGLTHGFRNRFAEAISNNDRLLCKKYVSTSYLLLSLVFIPLFIVITIINKYISWCDLLNLNTDIENLLKQVVLVISFCFAIKNILSVFTTMLSADQRPAIASVITTIEAILILVIICILTQTTKGNLVNLAIVSSGVPMLLLVVVTLIGFIMIKRYSYFVPSFKFIDFSLSKKILLLGGKFFIIQLCMLVIFQTINIIISRNLGPDTVTLYNVTYKYYGIVNSIFIIILTPFWSATTNAYVKNDIDWIKKCLTRLEVLLILSFVLQVMLLVVSPFIFKMWLRDAVNVPWSIAVLMAINVLLLTSSQLYMYLINGIGKVSLQLIVYVLFATVSIPLMSFGVKIWGLEAIIIVTSLLYILLIVLGRMQLNKLLAGEAKGIWNK